MQGGLSPSWLCEEEDVVAGAVPAVLCAWCKKAEDRNPTCWRAGHRLGLSVGPP